MCVRNRLAKIEMYPLLSWSYKNSKVFSTQHMFHTYSTCPHFNICATNINRLHNLILMRFKQFGDTAGTVHVHEVCPAFWYNSNFQGSGKTVIGFHSAILQSTGKDIPQAHCFLFYWILVTL